MGHETRSQVLINIQIQDGILCLACSNLAFYSASATLKARHSLESMKAPFVDKICLKELGNYLLVRSISLDEEMELEG